MDKLEKVIKGLECCESERYNCAQCPYIEENILICYHILRHDALELLKEKQPKWIPVDERLPEENKDVLVYINVTYRDLAYAYCDMAYHDEGVWYDEEHNHLKNITHWMPLPEPPKEGE